MKASSVRRILVLAAAMLCTVLSAQSNRRTPSTVVLDPAKGSPFNDGVFEGWGTSLCWWANRVGYSDKLTNLAVDAFFDQTKGLKLNIVRYNIGGGDDPSHRHITRSDSNMPGFAQPVRNADGSFEVDDDGIVLYKYDWERDKNQMNVLTKLLKRNPDALVEVFSNSPPYFMTWSGCSSGGAGEHRGNNLRPEYIPVFAEFLADVVKHMREDLHMKLNSIDPFNEPSSNIWGAYSNKQEGCNIGDNKVKSSLIVELDKALRKRNVRDGIMLAVADETSIDLAIDTFKALSPEAKKVTDRINTHTYGGSRRAELQAFAKEQKKHLWMSEVDGIGTVGGQAAGDMGSPLWLASRIITDVNGMMPSAWVICIRPGDRIIASSPSTLAAWNRESGRIVVVAVNGNAEERPMTFDLAAFPSIPAATAKVIRTSGPVNAGENWNEDIPAVPIRDKKLSVRLAPFSITTFVIGK